jgi:hypothetical protein
VTAAARSLEARLRDQVAGGAHVTRGGSDANTDDAITSVATLSEAVPAKQAREIIRDLTRWTLRFARLKAIDEAVLWQPIRMRPGSSRAPVCPYCHTPNLRVADRSYVVMCFYPDCPGDSNGTVPPFARLDVDRRTGAVILAWDDGLTETAQDAH